MNLFLKSLAHEILFFLGTTCFPKITKSNLTILNYHSVVNKLPKLYDWCYVDAESFKQQIRYLKENFEVVSLTQVALRLKSGNIDKPLAVITLDDGYQNNFDVAFPILKEEGLPATIFLTTELISSDDTLWGCRLHHALSQTGEAKLHWEGDILNISDHNKKVEAIALIKNKLKKMSISKISTELRVLFGGLHYDMESPVSRDSFYRMLDYESIDIMVKSGLIDFGAHTLNHEILSRLSKQEQGKEILNSVKYVSELLGQKCRLFAYPNGAEEDYNRDTIDVLVKCGIEVAVTTIEEANNDDTPILELRRYGIGSGITIGYFKLLLSNIIPWVKRLRLST